MASSSDSRPFIDLRRNAVEFRKCFDEDVLSWLDLLESRLSTLVRDPDSLDSPSKEAKRLGAHVEFSKAKLEIFLSVKEVVEETQIAWKEKLDRMIYSFLENVEILLASTTLEDSAFSHEKKNGSKNRKSIKDSSVITSSINASYSLINSAKKLPAVINSFLSQDNEDEEMEDVTAVQNAKYSPPKVNLKKSPKLARTSSKTVTKQSLSNNKGIQDDSSDEDNEIQEVPQSYVLPARKSSINTSPVKQKAELPQSYVLPTRRSSINSSPVKENAVKPTGKKEVIERTISTRRGATAKDSVCEESVKSTPNKTKTGKKSILKLDPSNNNELHATPSRSTRNRTAVKESIQGVFEEDVECIEIEEDTAAAPKTPKNVHFSVGFDVEEDLEIYSPMVQLTRSAPRRKTVMISDESSSEFNVTPNVSRAKRKTIGGSAMDVSVAPSPKRLKRGKCSVVLEPTISEEKEDHLESDDPTAAERYTPWILLEDLDAKVPQQPGIYELKVYKAKKSAYIGSCENLRQKLTLHKLGQNSGHKHLDKFLDRNKREVQVRYERMSSAAAAKNEEMNRIKAFVSQHRTTPAYN